MSVIQINGRVVIDGAELPPCPSKSKYTSSTVINDNVYVNGYEFKNGTWKRTLIAMLYYILPF